MVLNGLNYRVINNIPIKNFRNIFKSNPIILFKDNFIGLYITY